MQLFVDEEGLEVVKIVMKGREGMDTEYLIERFNVGVEIPHPTFHLTQMNILERQSLTIEYRIASSIELRLNKVEKCGNRV